MDINRASNSECVQTIRGILMSLGIHSWLFYGLGVGKKIRSVEPWHIFSKHPFSIQLDFSHESFGGLPASELSFLVSAAKYLNCKNVFEFGTCTGATTYNLALNTAGKVYTLDLPEGTSPALKLEHAEEEYLQGQFKTVYWSDKPERGRIQAIRQDSAQFDTKPFAGMMDLIFVDASHSYNYVLNDSQKALQMLNPRGAIVWHDYMPAWPGVIKALNELSKKIELFHIKGTSLVIHLSPKLSREMLRNN